MSLSEAQVPANTTWAFATLGQLYETLLVALARAARLRLSELAQEIANTALAFAKLRGWTRSCLQRWPAQRSCR